MKRGIKIRFFLGSLIISVLIASIVPAGEKTPTKAKKDTTGAKENITENLSLEWPKDGHWNMAFTQDYGRSRIEYFYPEGQSSGNWNESGSTEIAYGKTRINGPGMARMIFLGTQKGCPDATWDIVERGTLKETWPYIIFEIKCPEFLSDEPPQVQLWKIIGGKTAMFTIHYAHKGKEMTDRKRSEILDVLRNAHLITGK